MGERVKAVPPEATPAKSSWTRKYGDRHRFERVTDFPAGIVPPRRVRIYRRNGHHLLRWWDPAARRNLAERVDGDLVTAIVRARQVEERITHFRAGGQLKPGPVCFRGDGKGNCQEFRQRGNFQDDFVNAYAADAQGQITLQTDYLHGRLSPRLTYIQFLQGTAALHPTLTYRWNDWLLFQADYQYITGAYQALGFFRDRDQVSLRMTYQLN